MTTDASFKAIMDDLKAKNGVGVTVPDGWAQGRALYGGLVAALAAEPMAMALESPRPIRTLLGNFVAPAPVGDLDLRTEILREGRAVVQTRCDVMAGDQVVFAATAAFGDDRPSQGVPADFVMDAKPRDSVPPMAKGVRVLPGFLDNFDVHWTGGGVPMSGSKDRKTGMWVRHKSDMSAYPIAKLVGLADMPPPVMMSHYDRPIRASSMSWSLEFVVPPQNVETDWFYLDFTLEAAANGYSQQSGLIFAEDGTLVALSRQCMVYFE